MTARNNYTKKAPNHTAVIARLTVGWTTVQPSSAQDRRAGPQAPTQQAINLYIAILSPPAQSVHLGRLGYSFHIHTSSTQLHVMRARNNDNLATADATSEKARLFSRKPHTTHTNFLFYLWYNSGAKTAINARRLVSFLSLEKLYP